MWLIPNSSQHNTRGGNAKSSTKDKRENAGVKVYGQTINKFKVCR